jgi:hypothetical protein
MLCCLTAQRFGLAPGPPAGPGGFSQLVPGGLSSRSHHRLSPEGAVLDQDRRFGDAPGPPLGPGGFSQLVPGPPLEPGGLLSRSGVRTTQDSMPPSVKKIMTRSAGHKSVFVFGMVLFSSLRMTCASLLRLGGPRVSSTPRNTDSP